MRHLRLSRSTRCGHRADKQPDLFQPRGVLQVRLSRLPGMRVDVRASEKDSPKRFMRRRGALVADDLGRVGDGGEAVVDGAFRAARGLPAGNPGDGSSHHRSEAAHVASVPGRHGRESGAVHSRAGHECVRVAGVRPRGGRGSHAADSGVPPSRLLKDTNPPRPPRRLPEGEERHGGSDASRRAATKSQVVAGVRPGPARGAGDEGRETRMEGET